MSEIIPVLMVGAELAPWYSGGVLTVLQNLANALAASGRVRVTVLGTVTEGCRPSPPDYNSSIEFELVEKPKVPDPFYHSLLQVKYRAALRKWLGRNPGGIVHFNILPGARGFLAALAAVRHRAPRVLAMNDWPPLEIPYYHRPEGHWAHWLLARTLIGRFPNIVANSHYIAQEVEKAYPNSEVIVIPHAIRPDDWDLQEPPPLLDGSPRFLCWGNLWRKKGVHVLLQAFALLRQRGFLEARLYIVGKGEEEGNLKRLGSRLGLDQAVKFLGRVPHAKLRGLIHASDVAVFPSVYEGFGIAILEAMVCGKATVTTARGGPREIITDGKDGILVEEWEPTSLAGALERVASSTTLAQAIGKNARETALRYSWQAVVPSYIDLYAKLAGTQARTVRDRSAIPHHDLENARRSAPAQIVEDRPNGIRPRLPVLMIAPELHPWKLYGVAEVVRGLSNALAEMDGLELTLLATVPRRADPYAAGYSRQIKFLLVNKPNSPEPFYHLSLQIGYLRHFLKWRKENPKGVVHFEILPGARSGSAAAACILSGCPRIVTLHGWPPAEISFEQTFPRKLGHWGHWVISRLLLPFFPCLVVNSRHMRQLAAQGLGREKIQVIPNGLNFKLWAVKTETPAESHPSIAAWGSLNTRKGVWFLLKAYESYCSSGGSEHPPLFLIGDGEEIGTMQNWVKEKGLSNWVKFLGEHSPERIKEMTKSVPIAVLASPYEPFGIAALEAMAAGKAVIVPDRGGPIDFVRNEHNGLCVNVEDPPSFAAALSRLLIDSPLRERLAEEAQKTARNFEWPLIAPRYAKLYNEISGSGEAI